MKHILHLLGCLSLLLMVSCSQDDIDALHQRADQLMSDRMASIEEQATQIQNTLDICQKTDDDLMAYIKALQKKAAELQKSLEETDARIEPMKEQLTQDMDDAKAEVLAQLEALRASMEEQLQVLNLSIEQLNQKDQALNLRMDTLNVFVSRELAGARDWSEATFATLGQLQKTEQAISEVETGIKALNASLTAMESRVMQKITKDLAFATDSLLTHEVAQLISKSMEEVTTAYTQAITSAKTELTDAYNKALKESVAASQKSLQNWVNQQLTAYSTVTATQQKLAETGAAVRTEMKADSVYLTGLLENLKNTHREEAMAFRDSLASQVAVLKKTMNAQTALIRNLSTQLANEKTAITQAYKKAISDEDGKYLQKIDEMNKQWKQKMDAADTKIASLNTQLQATQSSLAVLQKEFLDLKGFWDDLFSNVRSLTYLPEYYDGKATLLFAYNPEAAIDESFATLQYEVFPAKGAKELVAAYQNNKSLLEVKAIKTYARAEELIEMPVVEATATDEGILTVKVSGKKLYADYAPDLQPASVRLKIVKNRYSLLTDYVPLEYVSKIIQFEDPIFKQKLLNYRDPTTGATIDLNQDVEISEYEAGLWKQLTIRSGGFTSIKGIEFFKNLKELVINHTHMTQVDLSKNSKLEVVDLQNDNLSTLNVSGCTALKSLYCYSNQLTTLDVSGCTALQDLGCSDNQLTSLNVTGCTALKYLQCSVNHLTSLNVSDFTALKNLDCSINQLTSLNVSGCTALKHLDCSDNQLTSLDISTCTALQSLYTSRNQLTTLDVSHLKNTLNTLFVQEMTGPLYVWKGFDPSKLSNFSYIPSTVTIVEK